jgi:hypothetical protein
MGGTFGTMTKPQEDEISILIQLLRQSIEEKEKKPNG